MRRFAASIPVAPAFAFLAVLLMAPSDSTAQGCRRISAGKCAVQEFKPADREALGRPAEPHDAGREGDAALRLRLDGVCAD